MVVVSEETKQAVRDYFGFTGDTGTLSVNGDTVSTQGAFADFLAGLFGSSGGGTIDLTSIRDDIKTLFSNDGNLGLRLAGLEGSNESIITTMNQMGADLKLNTATVSNLSTSFASAYSQLTNLLDGAWTGFTGFFNNLVSTIANTFITATKAVTNSTITGFPVGLFSVPGGLTPLQVYENLTGWVNTLPSKISVAVNNLSQELRSRISLLEGKINNVYLSIPDNITSYLNQLQTRITQTITPITNSLSDVKTNLIPSLQTQIDGWTAKIANLPTSIEQDVLSALGISTGQSVSQWFQDKLTSNTVFSNIRTTIDTIENKFDNLGSTIKDTFQSVSAVVSTKIKDTKDNLLSQSQQILSNLAQIPTEISNAAKALTQPWCFNPDDWHEYSGSQLGEYVASAPSGRKYYTKSEVGFLGISWGQTPQQMKQFATEEYYTSCNKVLMKEITTALGSVSHKIYDAVRNLANMVKSLVSGLGSVLGEVGDGLNFNLGTNKWFDAISPFPNTQPSNVLW